MIKEINVTCQKCQTELGVNIFDVISLDDFHKELLKKNELFTIECYNCHNKIKLDYDCLCLDEKKKYAIALCHEENIENISNLFSDQQIEYKKRIVNDSFRLLEKVYIFDNNFDDRIIEIMKCIDIIHILKDKGTECDVKDYFVCEGKKFYFYVIIDEDSYHLDFDFDLYDQIQKNISLVDDENLQVIDYNCAVKKVSDLV